MSRCHATYMDVGSYDSKEGIGRVESGTETESNAGAVTEMAVRLCTVAQGPRDGGAHMYR